MVKYVFILVLSLFSTVWAVDFTAHLKGAPVSDEAISRSWDIRAGNNAMIELFSSELGWSEMTVTTFRKQAKQGNAGYLAYVAYWYGYNQGIVTSFLKEMER